MHCFLYIESNPPGLKWADSNSHDGLAFVELTADAQRDLARLLLEGRPGERLRTTCPLTGALVHAWVSNDDPSPNGKVNLETYTANGEHLVAPLAGVVRLRIAMKLRGATLTGTRINQDGHLQHAGGPRAGGARAARHRGAPQAGRPHAGRAEGLRVPHAARALQAAPQAPHHGAGGVARQRPGGGMTQQDVLFPELPQPQLRVDEVDVELSRMDGTMGRAIEYRLNVKEAPWVFWGIQVPEEHGNPNSLRVFRLIAWDYAEDPWKRVFASHPFRGPKHGHTYNIVVELAESDPDEEGAPAERVVLERPRTWEYGLADPEMSLDAHIPWTCARTHMRLLAEAIVSGVLDLSDPTQDQPAGFDTWEAWFRHIEEEASRA